MNLNVMIVDDEAHIRNGMRMKVDWEQLGMSVTAEACDGLEALKCMENGNIDLVITDINMPLMNGLAFIQKGLEINKDVKFIIVSGYGEFEYARTAMKFGITEYLLKPLKETDLQASLMKIKEEILAIESVWQKEYEKREQSKIREEALLHLLTDKQTPSAAGLERDLKLELHADNIVIGVVKMELHDTMADSAGQARNYTVYHDIESAFNSVLGNSSYGYIVKSIRPEHEFILLLAESRNDKEKTIRLLTSIIGDLMQKLGIRVTIGLGGTQDRAHSVKQSYSEALFAVKERMMCGAGRVIDFAKIPVKSDKPNFSAETKLLMRYLEDRKWNNVKEHIDYMFRHSIQKGIITNHNHVYELFIEIYFAIKQFARGEAANQETPVLGSGEAITEIVGTFSHTDQMVDWLYQYTESVCYHLKEGQDTTGKEIVYRVKKYIHEFYSSDLTLNLVSEKYHINPIYFSRIFKTHIGESFNSYITRIRMEEAKNLMETTSLKMQDISEIVGYEDPKYFSKVFKKYFGVSPSLYK